MYRKKVKFGTLYAGDSKIKEPFFLDSRAQAFVDIPLESWYDSYRDKMVTVKDSGEDRNDITWVPVEFNGKKLYIADRNWLRDAYTATFDKEGAVRGKIVTVDGVNYKLRGIEGGKSPGHAPYSEYDMIILNAAGFEDLPRPTIEGIAASAASNSPLELREKFCNAKLSEHFQYWNLATTRGIGCCDNFINPPYSDTFVVRGGKPSAEYKIAYQVVNGFDYRPVLEEIGKVGDAISVSLNSGDIGSKDTGFDLEYVVKLGDSSTSSRITISEFINEEPLRSPFTVDDGSTVTYRLSNRWSSLPWGKNTIRIHLVDEDGISDEVIITFNRVPLLNKDTGLKTLRESNNIVLEKVEDYRLGLMEYLTSLGHEVPKTMRMSDMMDLLKQPQPDRNSAPIYTVVLNLKTGECHYEDAAAGRKPASLTDTVPWADVYPFSEIRGAAFTYAVNKPHTLPKFFLKPENFKQSLDGTSTSTSDDIMVHFPLFFWRVTSDEKFMRISICKEKRPGFINLSHLRPGGDYAQRIFIGAYRSYVTSSKACSRAGVTPSPHYNSDWDTYCGNAGFEQFGYQQLVMIQILFALAYKTIDSFTLLGKGAYGGSATTATTYNSGGLTKKGDGTQVKLLGLEELWGYGLGQGVPNMNREIGYGTYVYSKPVPAAGEKTVDVFNGGTVIKEGFTKSWVGDNYTPFMAKELTPNKGDTIWHNQYCVPSYLGNNIWTLGGRHQHSTETKPSLLGGSFIGTSNTYNSRIMFVPNW